MDNYNALSKSAILTKLALDGYFIDLLTLNSFIKDWGIEAIYENEFGIEFFDNTSYLTILNNLKTKYGKSKTIDTPVIEKQAEIQPDKAIEEHTEANTAKTAEQKQAECLNIESKAEEKQEPARSFEASFDKTPSESAKEALEELLPAEDIKEKEPENIQETFPSKEPVQDSKESEEHNDGNVVDINSLVQEEAPEKKPEESSGNEAYSLEELASGATHKEEYESKEEDDTESGIMPRAMKNLTPGPVTPDSQINVDHSYIPQYNEVSEDKIIYESEDEPAEPDTMEPSEKGKNLIEYDDELMQILSGEDFSAEEIEKADKLMSSKQKEENKETPGETPQENHQETKKGEEKELDLIQLAQSFAQNLTGAKEEKEVPPADLEKIFEESYTEPFEELQHFVQEEKNEDKGEDVTIEEYKSLQEDLPLDIEAINGQTISVVPANPASVQGISSYSNLTPESVREIIREEISRQTKNSPQIPNNDSIKNLVREIVKQTADVAPQNAFKLDISNRTLDLIAKAIAKKIAVKLNDYYKLNSSKQNAKLQMFRDKTIELKEKNQALFAENKKLKTLLFESNKDLNSYKPTIFGLFKYEGKKRK